MARMGMEAEMIYRIGSNFMKQPESVNKQSGFTMLELLVVLLIVALISGIGLTFISSLNKQFSFPALRGAVVSLLRFARNQAFTEKTSSYVIFDSKEKQMYGLIHKNIRLWHMENIEDNKTSGAFGFNGEISGDVTVVTHGRYGNSLMFKNGGTINFGNIAFQGDEVSLILEMWVYPVSQTEQTVMMFQNDPLTIKSDLSVECKIGDLQLISAPNIIRLGKWTHFKILYDSDDALFPAGHTGCLRLFLDDKLVLETIGVNSLGGRGKTFFIGSASDTFCGKIDEVIIGVIVEVERKEIQPLNVLITSNIKPVDDKIKISFNAQGNLENNSAIEINFSLLSKKDDFNININSSGIVQLK